MTPQDAVTTFSGRTYADEAAAMADLERLINDVVAHKTRDLLTALEDAVSTYRHDVAVVVVTAERQEAWQAVLDRHQPPKNPSP